MQLRYICIIDISKKGLKCIDFIITTTTALTMAVTPLGMRNMGSEALAGMAGAAAASGCSSRAIFASCC
jgi:hypothetical protein